MYANKYLPPTWLYSLQPIAILPKVRDSSKWNLPFGAYYAYCDDFSLLFFSFWTCHFPQWYCPLWRALPLSLPKYYVGDLSTADVTHDTEGILVNNVYVNNKAHVYQPLELK